MILIETVVVFLCVHAIGWTNSMHLNETSSYQYGDHVLICFLWDNTTQALDVKHEFPSNKTQITIAKCDENRQNESVCSLTRLSHGYAVWGQNRTTYLVIEEMKYATAGMYFFIDRNNPNINLSIDVQPTPTTGCEQFYNGVWTCIYIATLAIFGAFSAAIAAVVQWFILVFRLIFYIVYSKLPAPAQRRIDEWINQQTARFLRRNEVNLSSLPRRT
ncbi:uncharacterized protein LOC127842538 [Dreissena polymorpha]|uniref:uncharacterized protein LOC127842538 n=1 Tax=Dreissena polymorpha TaxID=45954 RepID=UPI0022641877|nr:uncharacterized protein LOC127842538 [Dreissena polymorpha]